MKEQEDDIFTKAIAPLNLIFYLCLQVRKQVILFQIIQRKKFHHFSESKICVMFVVSSYIVEFQALKYSKMDIFFPTSIFLSESK